MLTAALFTLGFLLGGWSVHVIQRRRRQRAVLARIVAEMRELPPMPELDFDVFLDLGEVTFQARETQAINARGGNC